MNKNILGVLHIADHEIRLLVGEFFESRLNILKVEQVEVAGSSLHSFNSDLVSEAIRKAVVNASRNLGVVIEKVLLMIPSNDVVIEHAKVNLLINGHMGEDIYTLAYSEALKHVAPESMITVNALISHYYINGNLTKRNLVNEICEQLSMDVDYYYAPKSLVFKLVNCVEKIGLQIIDIGLDGLSFAKEASLFDASLDLPVIGVSIERESTHLYLYNKGALISSQMLQTGSLPWLAKLSDDFGLPLNKCAKILYYNLDLSEKEQVNAPIYLWSSDSKTNVMSYNELKQSVSGTVSEFLDTLRSVCEPILESKKVRFVLTGEAAMVSGLDEALASLSDCEVTAYYPETFGVRETRFGPLIGMFYLYKDMHQYRSEDQNSVDIHEFDRVINSSKHDLDSEDSITKRLKKFFFDH